MTHPQIIAELRKLHAEIVECDEGRESPMMALVRQAADEIEYLRNKCYTLTLLLYGTPENPRDPLAPGGTCTAPNTAAPESGTGAASLTNEEMQRLTVAGLREGMEIMREALQALYDEQHGPPLLRREAEWNAAMELARGALALEKQPVEPEARLTEMNFKAKAGEPIEAYAQFEGGAVKAFAVSLVQWFRESGGENYVTCDLRDPETGEAYSITMQKAGGRTPAQDLCELRQQLNRPAPTEKS